MNLSSKRLVSYRWTRSLSPIAGLLFAAGVGTACGSGELDWAGPPEDGNVAGNAGSGGEAGSAGSSGEAGSAGSSGEAGTGGSSGESGSGGSGGESGAAGEAGSSGEAGSGGSSGEAGSGGDAGTGGSICATTDECPGVDTACATRTCEDGVCGVAFAPAGPASAQVDHDCKSVVCDGEGNLSEQPDDNDAADDGNPCTIDTCVDGSSVNTPANEGTACNTDGGKVCSNGACVACVTGGDCESGVCQANACVSATCSDGEKNGDETGTDCGGSCGPCGDGVSCGSNGDCESGVCDGDSCAAASCSDGIKNGGETDADCGGSCAKKCATGLGCSVDGDCVGGSCSGTVCLPSCSDGVKNGTESAIDCGGTCSPCENGSTCSVNGDCKTGLCSAGTCKVPTCGDGILSGAETCDDGNTTSGDGCSATCGIEPGYSCSGAPSTCVTVCGDGLIVGTESCDDGNTTNGDGCSATCTIEEGGWLCSSVPSVCAKCGDGIVSGNETCDDGNRNDGDCCSASCQVEAGCEQEINDTLSKANPLSSVLIGDKVNGWIRPAGEVDYYSFDVPAGALGNVTFKTVDNWLGTTCASGQMDTVVAVYNGVGVQIASNNDIDQAAGNLCSSVSLTALVPGTYYVSVKGASDQTSFAYSLKAELQLAVCGNGIWEQGEECDNAGPGCSACKLVAQPEPADLSTCSSLREFPLLEQPVLFSGRISSSGEKDFYAFSLTKPTDVDIETFDANGPGTCAVIDTVIGLYTSNCSAYGAEVDQDGIGSCSHMYPGKHTVARQLPAGSYFVRARGFMTTATFDYSIRIKPLTTCGNNVKEGYEECDGGEHCDVNCKAIPYCGDGLITWSLGEQCDDGNNVDGDGCSANCKIELLNEIESNNSIAEADGNGIVISADTMVSAKLAVAGDKDFYKLVVVAPTVLRLETFDTIGPNDCASANSKTLVRLFDASGTQIAVDAPAGDTVASGINNCGALVYPVAAGTYYVSVEHTTAGSTLAQYFLETKFVASSGNEIEPNDSTGTATVLQSGERYVFGARASGSDNDYYAITLPTQMSLRIELVEGDNAVTCESNKMDSKIALYKAGSSTALVTDDDDGRGYCSAIDGTGASPRDSGARNLAAGTYYILVNGSSSVSTGVFNYRLVVTPR